MRIQKNKEEHTNKKKEEIILDSCAIIKMTPRQNEALQMLYERVYTLEECIGELQSKSKLRMSSQKEKEIDEGWMIVERLSSAMKGTEIVPYPLGWVDSRTDYSPSLAEVDKKLATLALASMNTVLVSNDAELKNFVNGNGGTCLSIREIMNIR